MYEVVDGFSIYLSLNSLRYWRFNTGGRFSAWADAATDSVKVAWAVQRLAQHAISHSTAQNPCVLKHKTTTNITHITSIVLAALGGQHCGNFGVIWL